MYFFILLSFSEGSLYHPQSFIFFMHIGEFVKEVAEDYAKKLVEKGLIAEAKSSKEPETAGNDSS